LFSIKGRIVAITGGLGQLGKQFSTTLLEHGAKVAILDIDVKKTDLPDFFSSYQNSGNLLDISTDVT